AQVLLRIEARGGSAHQDPAASLHAPERGHPGVAASEVDDAVDAALVAAPLRLAVFLDHPPREIGVLVVHYLIGAELAQPRQLVVARGAGDDLAADPLREHHARHAD